MEGKSCPSTVPPSEVSPVCIVLFSVGCIWMHCCREQRQSSWLLFTLSSLRQILTILRVRQFGWTGWPANPKDPLVSASPTWLSSHTYPTRFHHYCAWWEKDILIATTWVFGVTSLLPLLHGLRGWTQFYEYSGLCSSSFTHQVSLPALFCFWNKAETL